MLKGSHKSYVIIKLRHKEKGCVCYNLFVLVCHISEEPLGRLHIPCASRHLEPSLSG